MRVVMNNNNNFFYNGYTIIESRILPTNKMVVFKEERMIMVGNIYPCFFLSVGKKQKLEDAVDDAIAFAISYLHHKIDSIQTNNPIK